VLALAAANVGLVGALHEKDSGSKVERGPPERRERKYSEALESGYPQTRWVREKTRKRAPLMPAAHTFSTAVDRDVDADKDLQKRPFYSR
jgi:hypothetical protein